jgi:hypothetical protein
MPQNEYLRVHFCNTGNSLEINISDKQEYVWLNYYKFAWKNPVFLGPGQAFAFLVKKKIETKSSLLIIKYDFIKNNFEKNNFEKFIFQK